MNIIKNILVFIFLLFNFLLINSISYSEDINETENPTETINLDEEELPAIDPFEVTNNARGNKDKNKTFVLLFIK